MGGELCVIYVKVVISEKDEIRILSDVVYSDQWGFRCCGAQVRVSRGN